MPRHATPRTPLAAAAAAAVGGEGGGGGRRGGGGGGGGEGRVVVQCSVSRHDDQTHIYMSVCSRVHKNVLLARGTWECTSVLSHVRTTHGASSGSSSS